MRLTRNVGMQELIGKCIVAPPCLLPEPGNGAKGMVSDHQIIFKMGQVKCMDLKMVGEPSICSFNNC